MQHLIAAWSGLEQRVVDNTLLQTFTILIDDLRPGLLTHKHVDDTTVTEIIEKGNVSEMQNTAATLVEWSELNIMNINTRKTKEMVMDSCGQR